MYFMPWQGATQHQMAGPIYGKPSNQLMGFFWPRVEVWHSGLILVQPVPFGFMPMVGTPCGTAACRVM